MDNGNGKWALVTGASSGFGIEFATLLAEQNTHLISSARRTEPMAKLAEQLRQKHRVNVAVEGIDLSVVGTGAELKSRHDQRGIAVDVLVNNAGCGFYGNFGDQPLERVLGMLQLTYSRSLNSHTSLQRTWWHAGQAISFWLPVCLDMRQHRASGLCREQGLRPAVRRSAACGTQTPRR